eukprot:COSAG06_NODE_3741_length_4955_cov_47.397309_5_plen_142_part_00
MTAYLYYNGFLVRNESSSGSVATVQMMNGTVDMAVLVLQEATGVLKADDDEGRVRTVGLVKPVRVSRGLQAHGLTHDAFDRRQVLSVHAVCHLFADSSFKGSRVIQLHARTHLRKCQTELRPLRWGQGGVNVLHGSAHYWG